MLRPSSGTSNEIAIVIRPSEPVSGSIQVFQGEHITRLTPLGPQLWVAIIPEWQDTSTFDLKITQDKRQFFKRYESRIENTSSLQKMADITHLSLSEELPRTTTTFDVPYYPINYSKQNAFRNFQWLPQVSSNFTIRGIKTISLRNKFIRGKKDGFTEGSQRDELLRINAKGTVNDIEVSATIQDSTTVLDNSNKNSIELRHADWDLYFGEYWANLNQTELMAYNKRLDGVKGRVKLGNFELTGLISESKGQTGFDRFYGTNSQGPYSLSNRPVVLYSEKLIYRGERLVRDTDYTIDYELGQVRFLKLVVPDTHLFTIDYEYSDSTFKRIFWAGYLGYTTNEKKSLTSNLQLTHLGASWQSLAEQGNAQSTSNPSLAPKSHYLFGVDSTYTYQDWFKGSSEIAASLISQKPSSGNVSSNYGIGFKQGIEIKTTTFKANGAIKSLGDQYRPLGNAYLNPGFFAYNLSSEYQPGDQLKLGVGHGSERYTKNNGDVSAAYIDTSTTVGPWSYAYYTRTDRDYSSTQNQLEKVVERNTGSVSATFGSLMIRPGVKFETLSSPTSPSSSYRAKAFTLDSRYIVSDEIQLRSTMELRNQSDNSGNSLNRKMIGLSSLVTLGSDYSVDGTFSTIDDSQNGYSALAVINYSLRPQKNVKLNGSYSLETVEEKIGTASYRRMNHQGNFQFSVRPTAALTLGYKFKPTLSELLDYHLEIERRIINQYSLANEMSDTWRIGADYKTTDKTLLDKTSIGTPLVSQKGTDQTLLFQSDLQLDSTQSFRYALETNDTQTQSLKKGSTQIKYDNGVTETILHNLEYLNQITSTIRLAGAYRGGQTIIEQSASSSSNSHLQNHTLEGSSEWNPDSSFNLKFTGSGTQTIDVKGIIPDTYLGLLRNAQKIQ